jgi:hypothetical protein
MVRTEAFVGAVLVLHNREHIIIKLMHGWNTSTVTEPPHVPYHLLNEKKKKKNAKLTLKPEGARTSNSLIGLYSMPKTRWTPSVMDSLRHLFRPAGAF